LSIAQCLHRISFGSIGRNSGSNDVGVLQVHRLTVAKEVLEMNPLQLIARFVHRGLGRAETNRSSGCHLGRNVSLLGAAVFR
jgi:hypothetical protein